MSVVTSIIIIFPSYEDEIDRIKEINSFHFRSLPLDLWWIDEHTEPDKPLIYGGNKGFNSTVLLGSYNHFPLEDFLLHLQENVAWENIENVQVMVKQEITGDITFKVYSHAGKYLVVDSIKW